MSEIIKVRAFPFFERGRTFSSDMITSIRDYTFDFSNLYLDDCSDGIVSGCKIEVNNTIVNLTKGILKFKDVVYILNQPLSETYEATEKLQVLKLSFSDELVTQKSSHREVMLKLTNDLNLTENEIEVCRFKLKKGSKLRTDYLDFDDYNTEFDTVNRLHVSYCGRYEPTVSQDVLIAFATEALEHTLTPIDSQIVLTILSANFFTNKKVLEAYIALKRSETIKPHSHIEIYEALSTILKEIRGIQKQGKERKKQRNRQIIVD